MQGLHLSLKFLKIPGPSDLVWACLIHIADTTLKRCKWATQSFFSLFVFYYICNVTVLKPKKFQKGRKKITVNLEK